MSTPSSSNNAQKISSVVTDVTIIEVGVNYFLSHDAVMLSIQLSWNYDEKGDYVVDAIDLLDRHGTHKGYISRLNAETKEICYVLNTVPKRMVTTTFKHDDESKVLLDEIALSSFGI